MTFTVNELQDLIHILEERPEWRVQLLDALMPEARTLPDSLRALADAQARTESELVQIGERMERGFEAMDKRFEAMDKRFAAMDERMDRRFAAIDERFAAMDERFASLMESIRDINERMERGFAELRGHVSELKGWSCEHWYRSHAAAVFGIGMRKGHECTNDIGDQLYAAMQLGTINLRDFRRVLASDLLWEGQLRDSGETVVLAVEASWKVDRDDIERARERAAILRDIGVTVIPVVAGYDWPDELRGVAQSHAVVVVNEGLIDIESWQKAAGKLSGATG